MPLNGDVRLPIKKVGLCRECGKEIDVYPDEKPSGIVWYKVDAHEYAGTVCAGSNQLPSGKPMLRWAIIESPENEPKQKGFTLGF